ncbi:hypothetical protein ACJIZ3_008851 [Penstemon smallii]|uniref:Uncharacterized protein n=1 Tax=Penstemon smallii TaxID=265156 RepID=A0ABD3TC91_9LAMI
MDTNPTQTGVEGHVYQGGFGEQNNQQIRSEGHFYKGRRNAVLLGSEGTSQSQPNPPNKRNEAPTKGAKAVGANIA